MSIAVEGVVGGGEPIVISGAVTVASTTITGTVAVDVTDEPARQLGIVSVTGSVDTELPAAAALADFSANPTAPAVGAFAMIYDSSGAGTWVRWRGRNGHTYGDVPVTTSVTVTGAANAVATCTLPAAAGLFHYITHIYIARVSTAALAGGGILTIATTNLGGRSWRVNNQMSITVATITPQPDKDTEFVHALRSDVVNTNTVITCPAAGAAVSWHIVVDYFLAT